MTRAPDHDGHDHSQAHRHSHGHGHGHGRKHEKPTHELVCAPGHRHGHHHRGTDRNRVLYTLLLSAAVMVAEFVGGLLSGSLALKSDAVHMLTDVAALALTLVAIVLAQRPADLRRTYGYHRLEILAALANGLVLLTLSGAVFFAAYHRLRAPVAVRADLVMIFAVVGLAANLVGMWLLRGSHSLNTRGAYLHVASDALSSVAVLAGGITMYFYPALTFVDPLLSVLIGLAIVGNALWLVRDALEILLEAVPAAIDLEHVVKEIEEVDGVTDVHDLHIWTITSGIYALSAHVVVAAEPPPGGSDRLLTDIKQRLLAKYHIAHSTLQVESEEYEHVGHAPR